MKNNVFIFYFVLLVLAITDASPLGATDYYVDQNHPSANDQNTGTIDQPWKTITKANQTLKAGDTVYIRAGTYNTYVAPASSGTSGSRINYQNYGSETVTISGTPYAVYLNGDSYITVKGINSTGCSRNVFIINSSNYNIISYSSFTLSDPNKWTSSLINGDSQYNWLHHNTFSKGGECSAEGSDNGNVLDIGTETQVPHDDTAYNLIEDNTFFHGGHHVMGLFGNHNVIRNNYFHNEAWSNGRGNRNIYLNGRTGAGYNLIEGNRFGYANRPCDDYTVGNVVISTPYNIFRFNKLYHSNAYSIGTYSYGGAPRTTGAYNKIYNNTILNSGYNIYSTYEGGSEDTAIRFWVSSNVDNMIKNNLYYLNYQVYTGQTGLQTYANNWDGETQGDPLFVNASGTPPADKTDSTLPNLDLQSGSPAIDQGGALTNVHADDTDSGTSLIVDNAYYFQDGTWGPAAGSIQADWIAVGIVGNTVQISSINYITNTITLANSISRNNGDSVWLYKKSDGVQVLYGPAPDAGAYEYGQDQAPSAPRNLRIIP